MKRLATIAVMLLLTASALAQAAPPANTDGGADNKAAEAQADTADESCIGVIFWKNIGEFRKYFKKFDISVNASGMPIKAVSPGGPAYHAGLRGDDILCISPRGRRVLLRPESAKQWISRQPAGQVLEVAYYRLTEVEKYKFEWIRHETKITLTDRETMLTERKRHQMCKIDDDWYVWPAVDITMPSSRKEYFHRNSYYDYAKKKMMPRWELMKRLPRIDIAAYGEIDEIDVRTIIDADTMLVQIYDELVQMEGFSTHGLGLNRYKFSKPKTIFIVGVKSMIYVAVPIEKIRKGVTAEDLGIRDLKLPHNPNSDAPSDNEKSTQFEGIAT